MKYLYHLEDGQFSIDFSENYLIGKEGEIVRADAGRGDIEEIYILFIKDNYVCCIGDIDREFPKTQKEHDDLKNWHFEHMEKDMD